MFCSSCIYKFFTMFTAWILAFSCQLYTYRKSPSEIYIKKFYKSCDQHKGFCDYALDRSEKLGYLPWLLIITYHHDSTILVNGAILFSTTVVSSLILHPQRKGVPRRQSHHRSSLATLPSVRAIPYSPHIIVD